MRPARLLAFLLACTLGPASADDILLGPVHPDQILAISPAWRQQFDDYRPTREDVAALAELPRRARLDVYFGSWCGDSRQGVPHLLKILQEAPENRLKVRYVAVDRAKKEPATDVQRVSLERVPTFVLSVRGREIGRIVETPATTLEHDLAILVRRAADADR